MRANNGGNAGAGMACSYGLKAAKLGPSIPRPFQSKQTLRAFLNKQNDQREDKDLAEYGTDLRFENLVGDAQAKGRHHAAGELADAAEHHHQERVDDIALAEVRADVADLA